MPSPFPGMDPWLESPSQWGDFHHRFATELSNRLNSELPQPYYAKLEMRGEVGLTFDWGRPRHIVPDLAIVRPLGRPSSGSATAVADPRVEISFSHEVEFPGEQLSHYFVEIRDPRQEHRLVTLIEILSPSNKRPGADRLAYAKKQWDVLSSNCHLIEIDLLRGGERVFPSESQAAHVAWLSEGRPYVVLVNRAQDQVPNSWRIKTQLFAVGLREMLPVISIPLGPEVAEPPLDLQYIFQRVYDTGPYRRGAVDYNAPPDPPLEPEDAIWAEELLRHAGLLRATA